MRCLDPAAGGTVSYKQLADKVAVTFDNVLVHDSSETVSFQVEMFLLDGNIRITWLDIAATGGIAGLSEGQGLAADFAAPYAALVYLL